MNTGRIAGIILLAVAIIACGAGGVWLAVSSSDGNSLGGIVLGFVLLLLFLVLPVGAVGAYLLMRGRSEEARMSKARQQQKILNMVLTQGKVNLSEISLELDLTRAEVEDMVRDLVGKQLFTGAINWNDGILYSKEAAQLKDDHACPNCGGELQLAGKGVIECPWCGSEVFLHLD